MFAPDRSCYRYIRSSICNDPNDWAAEVDNPRYILDLLLSLIRLSVVTVKSLPELSFENKIMRTMKKQPTPRQREIHQLLTHALLHDGKLSHELYKYELVEHLDFWEEGLKRDAEDFVFVVTVNTGEVAMVAIRKTGELLVNEAARSFIQSVWQENYGKNMQMLLPQFVEDLDGDCFALTGVKIVA